MFQFHKSLCLSLALLVSTSSASAFGISTWNGSADSDWHNGSNWTPAGVPTSADDVVIPSAGLAPQVLSLDVAAASLRINASASLELLNGTDLDVTGLLDVRGLLASGPGTSFVRAHGDFSMTSTGVFTANNAHVHLLGAGNMAIPAGATAPTVVIEGGTRTSSSTTIPGLSMTAGSLHLNDNATLHVLGNADLLGGSLSFDTTIGNLDTLDIDGNLTVNGTTVGTTSFQSRVRLAGNWIASTAFVLSEGWVYLDGGDATVQGAAAAFKRLRLQSGVTTLANDAVITGTVITTAGSTAGPGWLDIQATTEPISSPTQELQRLRVSAGFVPFLSSKVGQLEQTGGELRINDNVTLTVAGDAAFVAGLVSFDTAVGNLDRLDINGSVTQATGAFGQASDKALLLVAGNFVGSASFVMPAGWVELDGGSPSSISGPAPTFRNLRTRNGTRTTLGLTVVTGNLQVQSGSTLALGANTLQVAKNLIVSSPAGQVTSTGPGHIELVGNGTMNCATTTLPNTHVVAGLRTALATRIATLTLVGGQLHVADNSTVSVEGDAHLVAGILSFDTTVGNLDTLDVEGALHQTATTVGSTAAQSRIRVAGDWTADSPFVLDQGWVYLDGGDANLGGLNPTFRRLELDSGIKTLVSDVQIDGTLISSGGSTAGLGWIELTANVQPIQTGANLVARLRQVSGTTPFLNSRLGDFEMTGGATLVKDNVTLTVDGDCRILGGTLSFDTTVGNLDTLDIEGDFYQSGGLLGTASNQLRIYCAGNWTSDTGFSLLNGWVYLDGIANTTIDGLDPSFNNLRISNGKRTDLAGGHVRGDLEVLAGAEFELTGAFELGNDLTVLAAGAQITGPGPIRVTAAGTMWTNSTPIPPMRLEFGVRTAKNSTLTSLELVGGDLHMADNSTLHVLGDVAFTTGQLSFDTTIGNLDSLVIDGNLTQSGATIGSTSAQSRLRLAGNWASSGPFTMDQGWVYLEGGDSTVGGPAPAFKRLDLKSGIVTLLSNTDITGTVKATGGSTAGGAWLVFQDNVEVNSSGANLLNRVRIAAGTIPFTSSVFGRLELMGGELQIRDNTTLQVNTDAVLAGGTLSFDNTIGNPDVLKIDGDLIQTGTAIGTDSTQGRIELLGNWIGDAPFLLPNGWVYLMGGGGSILGTSPAFKRLRLVSGTWSVDSQTEVTGTIVSVGGETVGPEWLVVTDNVQPISTGANVLGKLRIAGGVVPITNSRIGQLELVGGELEITDNVTLTVTGDAQLLGGLLSFDNSIGNPDKLVVEGSLAQTGTSIGTQSTHSRLYVAGDWHSNSSFGWTSGQVELDGGGTTTLGGSLPGMDPTFPSLRIRNGTRLVSTDISLAANDVLVQSGGTLRVTGDALHSIATPLVVDGLLAVEAGGRLTLDPSSSLMIQPTGRLELLGAPGTPAVLEGLPDDLNCTVAGTFAARDFEVRGPAASGLVVNGSLGLAPDDLRFGLFTSPSATLGSALLTLDINSAATLPGLVFEDPLLVGTYNVRRTKGLQVNLVNAGGGFSGATFEDDPGARIDWTTVTSSTVAGFLAKPGAEQVTLSWTSSFESPALSDWRLERAPTAAGPFSLVANLTPQGASSYTFVDAPLLADSTVFYRLLEVHTGGLILLVSQGSATPWSAALPSNVVTVGPGGMFATIQSAVDAASGPRYVISVETGAYPSFKVLGTAAGQVHVIADGSGPVSIDASTASVEIALLAFGQAVELVGLDITGGASGPAVFVHDNLGSVLFDELGVTGGGGQPGVRTQASLAVNVGRSSLTGTPGLSVGAAASVYVGRGALDQLDLEPGASVEVSGLTPGGTSVAPGATLVTHAGVMPDVACGSYQSLGVPFTITFEAEPSTFYQLATGAGMIPVDLNDPVFWQMLLLVNFTNYTVVNQGFTPPVTGLVSLPVELPASSSLLGAVLPLQGWAIQVAPTVSVRFSNLRTVVAMP